MNINEAFPSKYLKAADLQGKEVRVIMEHVDMEDIGDDRRPVLYFQGKEKGVVLNRTNSNNIGTLYGFDTDNWIGKPVILFTAWVDFQGKSVEAIRIRPPSTADQAPKSVKPKYNPRQPHPGPQESENPAAGLGEVLNDEIPF